MSNPSQKSSRNGRLGFKAFLFALVFFGLMVSQASAAEPTSWQSLGNGIDTSFQDRGQDRGIYLARIDLTQPGVSVAWQTQAQLTSDSESSAAFVSVNSSSLQLVPTATAHVHSNVFNPFPIYAMALTPDSDIAMQANKGLRHLLEPKPGFNLQAVDLLKSRWVEGSDRTGNYTAAALSTDGKTLYIATAKHLPLISLTQCLKQLQVGEALLLQEGKQAHFVAENTQTKQRVEDHDNSFYDYHAGGLDALLGNDSEPASTSATATLMAISR